MPEIEEEDVAGELNLDEEQPLYEHHHIKVERGQETMRIDKFIMMRVANTTRTKVQNSCEAGNILLNGKPVKSNYKIKPLDEISILGDDHVAIGHRPIPDSRIRDLKAGGIQNVVSCMPLATQPS
ncbi:MAG: S4 domain-containing protein, partial [Bacteroidota bacterium]